MGTMDFKPEAEKDVKAKLNLPPPTGLNPDPSALAGLTLPPPVKHEV